jgi:hypothetical protein
MDIAISRNGVPIRLTEERWFHIVENHDDLAGHYDDVLEGVARKTYLAVIYKELSRDEGFVATAYFTSRISRRLIIWRKGRQ